ncbi:APC family permease [Kitasatospora sp. NPDC088346]|uniref:APC family permease n=1 Tax=Kitasatospora sp. NPDC088346 TaxID=3364073 RepID=UPI0037FC8290
MMHRHTRPTPRSGGLRANALGAADAVVMAIAGTAPAYTLAATTAVLAAAAGLASPASLFWCALPMTGVALAFKYLGRLDANAGASYSWVARALHPVLGFISGWALVVSATIFMVAAALPAGSYTLSLLPVSWPHDQMLATAVGALWFLLMSAVVVMGARITASAQWLMTGIEVTILLVVGITAVARGGVQVFSWSWLFDLTGVGGAQGFASVALIAAFYFWGWDVTANLGEETSRTGRGSGWGGLLGLCSSLVLFEILTIAVNLVLSQPDIQANSETVLAALGDALWPGWGGKVMVIAVMFSTIATLETTLIQVSRTLFAMGRDRTVPAAFGLTHPQWKTPWVAVAAVTAVSLVLLIASSTLGPISTILSDAFSAIGLQITVYYCLAGTAVVVAYRKLLLRSVSNAVFIGLLPLAGSLFMLWVLCQSLLTLDAATLQIGLGALAAGALPLIWYRRAGSDFYTPHNRLDAEAADLIEPHHSATIPLVSDHYDGRVGDL